MELCSVSDSVLSTHRVFGGFSPEELRARRQIAFSCLDAAMSHHLAKRVEVAIALEHLRCESVPCCAAEHSGAERVQLHQAVFS